MTTMMLQLSQNDLFKSRFLGHVPFKCSAGFEILNTGVTKIIVIVLNRKYLFYGTTYSILWNNKGHRINKKEIT